MYRDSLAKLSASILFTLSDKLEGALCNGYHTSIIHFFEVNLGSYSIGQQ